MAEQGDLCYLGPWDGCQKQGGMLSAQTMGVCVPMAGVVRRSLFARQIPQRHESQARHPGRAVPGEFPRLLSKQAEQSRCSARGWGRAEPQHGWASRSVPGAVPGMLGLTEILPWLQV